MTNVDKICKKEPRKRRRIRRNAASKRKMYFDADTQHAIECYQESSDQLERNNLYKTVIFPAFEQLIENLITVYKFHSDYDTNDVLKNDCIFFLYESLHKFDATRGTKAFSYFNVIARRWLIARSKKGVSTSQKIISLDLIDHLGRTEYDKVEKKSNATTHANLIEPSQDDIMIDYEASIRLYKLLYEIRDKLVNENEILCIDAIITLFKQAGDLPLHKKRAVLTYIRDMNGMTPKQLTTSLTVIKRYYNALKHDDEIGII